MTQLRIRNHLLDIERPHIVDDSRRGWLTLDRNENTIPPPVEVLKALASMDVFELHHYPEIGPLVDRLTRFLGVGEYQIALADGSEGVIKNVFEIVGDKGGNVVFIEPSFAMYDWT